jgi:anti-sigma factor RsiW
VGAVVAAGLGALLNAGFLASLGFAVLGLILGVSVGFGVAEVVALIGESLGGTRDLRPPVSVELPDGWAR